MPQNSLRKFAMRCSLLALLLFIAAFSCNAFASTDTIRYDYDNSYQVRKASFGNTSTVYSYNDAGNVESLLYRHDT